MATVGPKALCAACEKASGSMTCSGCGKSFCYRHVVEHRKELNKQMDEIITNHDQLKQNILEQEAQPICHPLIKRVDEWEQKSINTIIQAADDARQQLLVIIINKRLEVVNDLASLINKLIEAREEDNYVETDLKELRQKLDRLKICLDAAYTIQFGPYTNDDTVLISKYFINDTFTESFSQVDGDAKILSFRKVLMHGPINEVIAARCCGEYSSGQYRFRFKLEQLTDNASFSCGIISTSQPKDLIAYSNWPIPHTFERIQWSSNRILNNQIHPRFNFNNGCMFQSGHTYEVSINCDKQIICISNDIQGKINEFSISLDDTPFPWQFFVSLLYANDCVHLC